jgi:hypothetical protein
MKYTHDEKGKPSAMRALLFYVNIPVLVLMTFLPMDFPPAAWTTWSSISGFLVVGCFGPRVAEYLGPQLGSFFSSVKDAAIASRRANGDHEVTP